MASVYKRLGILGGTLQVPVACSGCMAQEGQVLHSWILWNVVTLKPVNPKP